MANTVGAGLGSLAGGFLFLPWLGMERSLGVLAASYGGVALLLLGARGGEPAAWRGRILAACAAGLAAALLLFPSGRMQEVYLGITARRFGVPETKSIAAVREGRTETVMLLRAELEGEPLYYDLITGGFGMASGKTAARRYMKLYVYWPIALNPGSRSALLISFGVGSTARALTDTRRLEEIDVVDISRDVLEVNQIVYPDPAEQPLRDPRVRVHIEDGRYFLQTTARRYDLITSEPPPPTHAGVVNLYTREYFELIRERLTEGGINTYWLPVHKLSLDATKSIIRGYCDAFADCSLWTGAHLDWMLVGSRGGLRAPSAEAFATQWSDPVVAPELRAVALEQPEQLGATFMADADTLRAWTGDAPPLVDNHPYRLGGRYSGRVRLAVYAEWMAPAAARRRFRESPYIRAIWPDELRAGTLAAFTYQARINQIMNPDSPTNSVLGQIRGLHALLSGSELVTLPLWHLQLPEHKTRAMDRLLARGAPEEPHRLDLALRSLAARDFERASAQLERVELPPPYADSLLRFRLYALCMAGRTEDANAIVRARGAALPVRGEWAKFWRWMTQTFGLEPPVALTAARRP